MTVLTSHDVADFNAIQDENTVLCDPLPQPTTRLMITKMELENFKSYAGVREIGPFHKCFSAVVGPNGSGKSNVIDAMLFVFGKRAKKLRLNKVSELIHKSDAVKDNPPTSARVSVYFQDIIDTDNGDNDFEIVPGSETVVSRIAKNDNSSSYKLNGKTCQFKDVATYLESKGIDLDNNRFLILQGEVEMISMMSPKGKTEDDVGLLEYLEEIIGSNQFVDQTNAAAELVETLTEGRQEKLNRVKAVEKEKDSLQAAKDEAEALLSKEHEIRTKKNLLYQIHSMKVKNEIENLTAQKTDLVANLDEERKKCASTQATVDELHERLKAQQRKHSKNYNELVQTREEFASYERRDIKLSEEIRHLKTQQKKLIEKIRQETKKITDAVSKGAAAELSIPKLQQRIDVLLREKEMQDVKLEELHNKARADTQVVRAELELKSQELAPLQQKKAGIQASLETVQTKIKLLQDSTNRAKESLLKAEKERDNIGVSKQQKILDIENTEADIQQCKSKIVDLEKADSQLSDREAKLVAKQKMLFEQAENAKALAQAEGGTKNLAVQKILKASRGDGPLSKVGVLGRLGDLATVSPQYDIAVSTACGMLDHVVVQTTAGVQRCLEFLRKRNLGRANFIPLDKMKKGAHDSQVETPEGAPRLFDLISPVTYSITPALFLAIGNTLVAPDLDVASRWAYEYSKRWRVVTLDGKLIDTAGTMTGGGVSVRKGGMLLTNSASAPTDLIEEDGDSPTHVKLENEAIKAQKLLQDCRSHKKELNEDLKNVKKSLKASELKLPRLCLEMSGFETTRTGLQALIPQLLIQCTLSNSDKSQIDALNSEMQKYEKDLSSFSNVAAKLEADVAGLQKAILDAGGLVMKKQQERCEKLASDIQVAETTLVAAQVAITTNEKAAAKAKKTLETSVNDLKECESCLDKLQSALLALKADALAVKQIFEKVQEQEKETRTALDEITKECEELKQSMTETKCKEIELLGQVESIEKLEVECEKRLSKWSSCLEKIRLEEANADINASKATSREPSDIAFVLPIISATNLETYSDKEILNDINVLEGERNSMAKNANMGAIGEYRRKEIDYLARVDDLEQLTEQRNEARKQHEDLRRRRLEMFMDGFGQITVRLKEMYQMITLGGDAELELVDSLDPFSEGIVFSVRPPKKSWKNISNLSGGEKTLSSLALVFALHHFKPTPLYVMDEIDAALDFKNVSIVANYIKERTRNAQFIIISLRNNMFELADRLVGIYKTNNCTKSVTIDPKAFAVRSDCDPPTPVLLNKSNMMQSSTDIGRSSLVSKDVRAQISSQSDP